MIKGRGDLRYIPGATVIYMLRGGMIFNSLCDNMWEMIRGAAPEKELPLMDRILSFKNLQEEVNRAVLTVTGKAADQLKEIMNREHTEDAAIRLYVSGVG